MSKWYTGFGFATEEDVGKQQVDGTAIVNIKRFNLFMRTGWSIAFLSFGFLIYMVW